MQISVIGSSTEKGENYELAYQLGKELAKMGHTIICGGRGGIMEAISKGGHEKDGVVVGIVPQDTRGGGNRYLSAEVVSGVGEMRNFMVVLSGDLILAFPGSHGTISELSFAMRIQKRIILIRPEKHRYRVEGPNVSYADDLNQIMNQISE